jgi:hypothetical protein
VVTDSQVRLLRRKRMQGKTLVAAAAAAGMSERTARTWKDGLLPSEKKAPRHWRTRLDPFAGVWAGELVPLLEADKERVLESRTLLAELEKKWPDQFGESQLRTLQRRVRDWRALHGPARDVIFPQDHLPGREGCFDFTRANELGVTIRGELFEHLLFEFVLSYSGWTWSSLAYSETFEALSLGLQSALWELGGCPEVARSDNLSAATHELKVTGGRMLTRRYHDLLDHYGMRSTRIRPGESHENGVAEQKHDRTKSLLAQKLVIRGSKDFESIERYEAFVREVVDQSNRLRKDKLALERERLLPLPSARVPVHTTFHPRVRSNLLGSLAAHRPRRGGTAAPGRGGAPLRRQAGGDDAEAAGRQAGPDRLPARDLVAPQEAGSLRAVSLPGGAVPLAHLPAGLRRPADVDGAC